DDDLRDRLRRARRAGDGDGRGAGGDAGQRPGLDGPHVHLDAPALRADAARPPPRRALLPRPLLRRLHVARLHDRARRPHARRLGGAEDAGGALRRGRRLPRRAPERDEPRRPRQPGLRLGRRADDLGRLHRLPRLALRHAPPPRGGHHAGRLAPADGVGRPHQVDRPVPGHRPDRVVGVAGDDAGLPGRGGAVVRPLQPLQPDDVPRAMGDRAGRARGAEPLDGPAGRARRALGRPRRRVPRPRRRAARADAYAVMRLFPVIATTSLLLTAGCGTPREAATTAGAGPLDTLRTRAEASGYTETSRYAEVRAFLDAVAAASEDIHLTTFGETVEGRALPLAGWGAPAATPEAVRATGKTRVLVFANIHAGEVAGKEALLALLRDLARGDFAAWADSLVLLAAPIYNADGNERIAYDNRPLQLGPVGGMGTRTNAQGLDLNRDFTKLAAPESRALVGLMNAYDPHVVVDLHTTDGTLMAYHLTYAPPLHPNTPGEIDEELGARWLPAVTEGVEVDAGWAFYHHGNVPGTFGAPVSVPRGWYSFDYRPRFGTNYAGLRNRFGILSEVYSYAPFDERVAASR